MLFKTRFRCAYLTKVKLAKKIKSLTHYAKGTLTYFYIQNSAVANIRKILLYIYAISESFHPQS